MAFVKLDCGMLDSTIWVDREARELFITALLMAVPYELKKSEAQLEVRTLNPTGFEVPPGWYGFVEASGPGIVHRAGLEANMEGALAALERLGQPEPESRTPDFEGRRLVRISGGYIALNYARYREKDHTAAVRAKRYRAKLSRNGKPAKSAKQVRAENDARERRALEAERRGDREEAERIAAEGLPDGQHTEPNSTKFP